MPLSSGDQNVVTNCRFTYGDKLKSYSDEVIAAAWLDFSQSEDYPDDDEQRFIGWCDLKASDM